MQSINRAYLYLYCLFIIAIPFTDLGEAIPNIIVITLSTLFPFVLKRDQLHRLNRKVFIAFLSLALFIGLETLIFARWDDLRYVSKLFLLLVIYCLSVPLMTKEHTKKLMYSFLLGTIFLLLASSFNIFKKASIYANFNLAVGDLNTLLLGDRPYLGFAYVIGFLIALFLVSIAKSRKEALLFSVIAFVLLIFLFLITARTSLLSLVTVAMLSVFYIKQTKLKLTLVTVVLIGVLGLSFFNQTFRSRLTLGFAQDKFSIEKFIKFEPRYYIWGCAVDIAKNFHKPFFGYGFNVAQDKLNFCYASSEKFINLDQKKWFIKAKFNSHNQYLNFYLSNGLLAFIIFTMVGFFCLHSHAKSFFALAISVSMLLFFMFENVLSRQMGVELVALVMIFGQAINLCQVDKQKEF